MQDYPEGFVKWEDVEKKEARGQNDLDLGEVHEIGPTWVHTIKGVGSKTHFYVPKSLVQGYDGHKVWFNITENQVNQFVREKPPSPEDYRNRFGAVGQYPNIESTLPVIQVPEHGRWVAPGPITGVEQGTVRRSTSTGRPWEPTAGLDTPGSEQRLSREDVKRPRRDENEY